MKRANIRKNRVANGNTKERSKWLAKSEEPIVGDKSEDPMAGAKSEEPIVGNKRRADGREYKRGANTKKQERSLLWDATKKPFVGNMRGDNGMIQ